MTELSKLMKQLGCTEAYNLDGGMTAMMAYGTELYSQPCGGGRQIATLFMLRNRCPERSDSKRKLKTT